MDAPHTSVARNGSRCPVPQVGPEKPAVRLGSDIRDFDQLALALSGWDATLRQLGRGAFAGRIEFVRQGALDVIRMKANRSILARGSMRQHRCTISLVGQGTEGSLWHGRHLGIGQLTVVPPGAEMDHRSQTDADHYALSVDFDVLCQAAQSLRRLDLERQLTSWQALTAPREASQRIDQFMRQRLREEAGASFDHQTPEERGVQLLSELLDARPAAVDRRDKRRQARRLAEDYMQAHLAAPVSVRKLCEHADVSERTLEYAFLEEFGLTPMAYFKTCRLNAVRTQLKNGGGERRLSDIARDWGFTHPGAFAADYRRQFGELPSQTRQTSRPVATSS